MKKIIFISLLLLFGCCKDNEDCTSEVQDDITGDIHYNKFYCGTSTGDYQKIYYSLEEYNNDMNCQEYSPVPTELDFSGIIATIAVEVPYVRPNNPAYEPSLIIEDNICDKELSIEYILLNTDTTQINIHNKTVVVFLNGYDDSYNINLSSKIIPFGG